MSHHQNLVRIKAVSRALEELADTVVFVGGATVSLYTDGRWSTDFEDIVYFLNNRTTIWSELPNCETKVRQYLGTELHSLLSNRYIDEWISAHLEYADQRRGSFIISSIRNFLASSPPNII